MEEENKHVRQSKPYDNPFTL
uniref:Uncharacterized protein n=1 Tax=Arundo donax TaxID=35708 RepID=A0A0A8ZFT7_ARUDO